MVVISLQLGYEENLLPAATVAASHWAAGTFFSCTAPAGRGDIFHIVHEAGYGVLLTVQLEEGTYMYSTAQHQG